MTARLRARGLATSAIALATLGVVGSAVLAFIPAWPLVLLEHFRFQYVCVGVLVVAVCAALRMRVWFDAALIATLVNTLWLVPDLSRDPRPLPADGRPLRVLMLNVHTSSTSFDAVGRLIEDVKPDLVGLVEVDKRWLTSLAPALTRFPHRIEQPRDDNFGIALYSSLPMNAAVEQLGSLLPTVVASLDLAGTPLGIVLTHPIPPVRREPYDLQRAQLAAIAARVHSLGSSVIVMGDLNATPWSRPFRELVEASGLCDSRAGFGLQASFPAGSALLRIPIDHVLVSCSIGVRSRAIERDVGSDHRPVLVELVVPRH